MTTAIEKEKGLPVPLSDWKRNCCACGRFVEKTAWVPIDRTGTYPLCRECARLHEDVRFL